MNSLSISARLLPLMASVIIDAEAVEIAQPLPSKRTSSTRSPFIFSDSDSRSPHSGL